MERLPGSSQIYAHPIGVGAMVAPFSLSNPTCKAGKGRRRGTLLEAGQDDRQ